MKTKNSIAHSRLKFGLRQLRQDERGMSTIEYVILLMVVVVGAVGLWNEIGDKFVGDLGKAKDELNLIQ